MLGRFAELAPVTAGNWGIADTGDAIVAAAIVSGVFWLLMSIIAWRLYRYGRSLVRNLLALLHTAWYRGRQAVGSIRTMLICRLREIVPRRHDDGIDAVPEIDFDDPDLAVLRVDKLRQNRMLDTVIGSTDGYGNFRLSHYGASFVAVWQRQQAS